MFCCCHDVGMQTFHFPYKHGIPKNHVIVPKVKILKKLGKFVIAEVNSECCNNGQYWPSWAALLHRLCGVFVYPPPPFKQPKQSQSVRLYTKHALWPSIESDIWMKTSELFMFLFDTLACIYPFVFLYLLLSCVYRMVLIKIHWRPQTCIINATQVSRGVLWHSVILSYL